MRAEAGFIANIELFAICWKVETKTVINIYVENYVELVERLWSNQWKRRAW